MIFILVLVLFAGIFVWSMLQSKKRRAAMEAWATGRGWNYAKSDRSLVRRWDTIPFTSGRHNSPTATDVMWGPVTLRDGQQRQFLTFTFSYTVTSGSGENQSSTTYHHHVTAVFLGVHTPALVLTPETFSTRVSKFFGGQDIQFESEDFNKAWRIESPDLKFAHNIVHPRMMENLLQGDSRGLSFILPGDCVMVFNNRRLETESIMPMVAQIDNFIGLIPPHVWADLD